MKTLKFAEIDDGKTPSLSLQHMQDFFKIKNIEIELVAFKSENIENLLANQYELVKSFNFLRMGYETSQKILENWQAKPTQVSLLGCCDSIVNENGALWPRVIMIESLRETIVSKIKDHDIKEAGYVICDDLKGRVLVAMLLSLGHRRVYLVGEDEDFINSEVEWLRRFHIGIEILALPSHQLTLQTTRATILINTVVFPDGDPILNDLAYFNFMKDGGAVLDLDFANSKNPLLREAKRAALKTIPRSYISAFYDFSLIQKLNLKLDFSFEEFEKSWQKFLTEKVQNSP